MRGLDAVLQARLEAWAREAWPCEACGFLLGDERGVVDVVAAPNTAASPLRTFAIAPLATLAAAERAARRGMRIVGTWHSHPESGGALSAADLEGDPFGCALVVPVTRPRKRPRS